MEKKGEVNWDKINTIEDCLCDRGSACLLEVERFGSFLGSFWIFQDDNGGETGYAVKFKSRDAFTGSGLTITENDMKDLESGLSWGMSRIRTRNVFKRWKWISVLSENS